MGTFIFGFGTSILFVRKLFIRLTAVYDPELSHWSLFLRFSLILEAFTIYAASALAAAVFLRSVVATFLPLVGPTLNDTLGLGWSSLVFH